MARRGVIVLSVGRSGSNWLGSLARNAGLGNSGEWLVQKDQEDYAAHDRGHVFFEAALDNGSSEAGFYVKIFPDQLLNCSDRYGEDFIRYCHARYNMSLIFLERRDRLRQAVSFSRALQSEQWNSQAHSRLEPQYNFDQICQLFFMIGRSYAFWYSYTALLGLQMTCFVYEDLLHDPMIYVRHVAECMGTEVPEEVNSELRIQRDELTDEWLERFRKDIQSQEILGNSGLILRPNRNWSNLNRFVRHKEMKIY